MLIIQECKCGAQEWLIGQPSPGITPQEMIELRRKKYEYTCNKCREEEEMKCGCEAGECIHDYVIEKPDKVEEEDGE